MAKHDVSAYLITQHQDYSYLTGFSGEDSAILLMPRAVHVISDSRFDEVIGEEIPWAKKHLRKMLLTDEVGKICGKLKLDRLAVQADGLTVETFDTLKKKVKPTNLAKAPAIVNGMRKIKDDEELVALHKAIVVAQEAFVATCASIAIGQTERELAARLEYEMRLRGAAGRSFETIVAEGANASHPHAHAGDRRVEAGSAILFDWGAKVGVYCSDLTRCVFMGRIPPPLEEVYKVVLDAQLAAIDAIRPGARMCDVDAVARKKITSAGYGKQFGHGLGHGLGIDVHEPPSLSWRSDEELAAGMVVTVEPGVYLPGVGGIRIEDDVVVTAEGCRVLSDLKKDLSSAVL